MLVDLVQVVTADGVRLHGALELPPPKTPAAAAVDAWLCIHGTGSNFYAASTLAGLVPKLLAGGAAVLRANTRGHDVIATGPSTKPLLGAAFEQVDEAPRDLNAWIALLAERGYRRIGLLGHSLGAIKAILTVAEGVPAGVVALAALSPPRLSYSRFAESPHREEFLNAFAQAEELVHAGRGNELLLIRFPIAYYVSAAGYVDRYGPAEKYNVLRLLDRIALPTLVTYGSSEVQQNDAFRGMPEEVEKLTTPANRLRVAVIAGADHIYTGCHDVLARMIEKWAGKLDMRAD